MVFFPGLRSGLLDQDRMAEERFEGGRVALGQCFALDVWPVAARPAFDHKTRSGSGSGGLGMASSTVQSLLRGGFSVRGVNFCFRAMHACAKCDMP